MNAYELYDAVFDSAREEYIPDDRDGQIKDVIDYADGCFGLAISRELAVKIVDARAEWIAAGHGSNNAYHMIEAPLSEIDIGGEDGALEQIRAAQGM